MPECSCTKCPWAGSLNEAHICSDGSALCPECDALLTSNAWDPDQLPDVEGCDE
jgi:hypothetical protein